MKTTIDGYEFEGTPEEIATYIKLFGKTEQKDNAYTPVGTFPEIGQSALTWNYYPDCCQHCPNRGKGPCMCTLPYYTHTGWSGNYTVATTTTYKADIPETFSSTEFTTTGTQAESGCSSGCKSGCNSSCKK